MFLIVTSFPLGSMGNKGVFEMYWFSNMFQTKYAAKKNSESIDVVRKVHIFRDFFQKDVRTVTCVIHGSIFFIFFFMKYLLDS